MPRKTISMDKKKKPDPVEYRYVPRVFQIRGHKLILKSSALMYVSQSEFTDRLLMWYACAFPNCFRHFALNTFSAAQTLGILKAPVNEYALTLSPVSPNPLMGAWCVLLLGVFGPRIPPPNPPGFEPPPPPLPPASPVPNLN